MENSNLIQKQTELKIQRKIEVFTIDNSSKFCYTIWFWRKKKDFNWYHSKSINLYFMRKIWKQYKVKPFWGFRDNGAKKKNGDTCFDMTIGLGYFQFNYINWDLQNRNKL